MRRQLFILLVILVLMISIVACSGERQVNNETADNRSQEDVQKPEINDEVVVEENEGVPEQDSVETPEPEPAEQEQTDEPGEPEPSLMEQYYEEFTEKVDYYAYLVETDYGDVIVWVDPDRRKYLLEDYLAEVGDDGLLSPTTWRPDSEFKAERIREQLEPLVDYVVYDADAKTYNACYLDKELEEPDCIWTNTSEDDIDRIQIIHDDVWFSPEPSLPTSWFAQFKDREPSLVRKGQLFKDLRHNTQFTVDKLYFDNDDGTQTVLYTHQNYKVPVKVEFLRDNKVYDEITYYYFSPNYKYGAWFPEFMRG